MLWNLYDVYACCFRVIVSCVQTFCYCNNYYVISAKDLDIIISYEPSFHHRIGLGKSSKF